MTEQKVAELRERLWQGNIRRVMRFIPRAIFDAYFDLTVGMFKGEIEDLQSRQSAAEHVAASRKAEVEHLSLLLNEPDPTDFIKATEAEIRYQRSRWDVETDAGKTDADWFWLIGYLAGKALREDAPLEKRLHRITTVAAACANWHAALLGRHGMRPGVAIDEGTEA
jgi:hypothetical protein